MGRNWARIIYIYVTPLIFLADGATVAFAMGFVASQLIALTLYGVFVYVLTREMASKFFGGPLPFGRSGSTTSQ